MKTTFYTVLILVVSFIAVKPNIPKSYPPKVVLEQRRIIEFREKKIENLIKKNKYDLEVNQIELKMIKNE